MARCDSYVGGQCTWGACELAGWIREGWGNAGQWADNAARVGFGVTGTPTPGAVVVFRGGPLYSPLGHCGLVEAVGHDWSFEVREMNYAASWRYDDRWTTLQSVVGFILPPGVKPGQGPPVSFPTTGVAEGELELAWANLASFWNYVIDAEMVGLVNITRALDGVS